MPGMISQLTVYKGPADAVRRPHMPVESGRDPVRPVAAASRTHGEARGRGEGVVIDLRPNRQDEAGQTRDERRAQERVFTRLAGESAASKLGRQSAPDEVSPLTRRANADTPYRRRSFEQTYEAAEHLDAQVSHRGSIFDLRI